MLPLSAVFFPGIAIPRTDTESPIEFLATRFLLSVGFNGFVFGLLRDSGLYSRDLVRFYLSVGWLVLACSFVVALRRGIFFHEVSNTGRGHMFLLALFGCISLYWALFFPPALWDSIYFHLPIAKISASESLFAFYSTGENRYAWLLQGILGDNNVELFLSVFFQQGSTLYRIVPPLFGGSLLVAVFGLAKTLGLGVRGQLAAGSLLVLAPAILWHGSDYYVDLPLTAYLTMSLMFLLRLTEAKCSHTALWTAFLTGALLGFGAITKKSGLVGLSLPLILGLFVFRSHDKLRSAKQVGLGLLIALGIAALIVLRYLLKMSTLPRAIPGSPVAFSYMHGLVRVGIKHLLWVPNSDGLNGATLLVYIGALSLCVLRVIRVDGWYHVFLNSVVAIWFGAVLFAIWWMHRLDYFNRWGRYLLPAYSLICVLVVLYVRQFLQDAIGTWQKLLKGEKSVSRVNVALSIIIPAIVVLIFIGFMPAKRIFQVAVFRYGIASLQPLGENKQQLFYGDAYRAWKYINDISVSEVPSAKVLTEDVRFFFLRPLALEVFSVPEGTHSINAIQHWMEDNEVKWIIASDTLNDFAYSDQHRGTSIEKYLRSGFVKELDQIGVYSVYVVKEGSP